jgi:hypothetical protein
MSTLEVGKIVPATGTAITLGESGDTLTVPSGATLAVASGATLANSGTATGFGVRNASLWRMTSTFAGSKDPIDANLAEATDVGQGVLGSSMTESSGVFTFPSTGYWYVTATFTTNRFSGNDPVMGVIKYTANNGGAWSLAVQMYDYLHTAAQMYGTMSGSGLFDITDTANQKVAFRLSQDTAGNKTSGSATVNYTYFTFVKLADT